MKRILGRLFVAAVVLAGFALSAATVVRAAETPLRYELKFEAPNTHLMDVTIRASGLDGRSVEFAMPDWAPGSYYIENCWMYVQGFRATAADGSALNWRKTDEQTWRIELNRATSINVTYQLYGDTLANNHAQYNEKHAFIGGPAVWMYLVNGKERPIELAIADAHRRKSFRGGFLRLVRGCAPRNFRFQGADVRLCRYEISRD